MSLNPTPTTKKPRRRMKWIAISLASVAVIWLAVILWWQAEQRTPATDDILVYLVALPILVLIGIALMAKRASQKNRNPADQTADAATTETTAAASPPITPATLPILGAWAATSLGLSADEFTDALGERLIRPVPDELLTDEDGFPVLSARVKNLDTSSIHHSLKQAIADGLLAGAPQIDDWRDAPIRALALLDSVFDQLLQDWPFDAAAQSGANNGNGAALPLLRGSSGMPTVKDKPFRLRVKLLVSSAFSPYENVFARHYAIERLHALPIPEQSFAIDLVATDDSATALILADEFRCAAGDAVNADALLLLACDSSLCPSLAQAWSAGRRLFEPRRPNGLMMGEGAFAILCANDKALPFATTAPLCRMTGMARAQRESSADTSGKASHACLAGAIETVLDAASISPATVASVVSDADHRASRTLECIGAMMTHTPQLDGIQNRLATNEACGHLGAASSAAMLTAAAIEAGKCGNPVLLFSVSHSHERAAAILLPDSAAMNPSQRQAA